MRKVQLSGIGAGIVICLVWLAASAIAQDTTGALRGVVSDDSGAVLPGILVTLTDQGSNRTTSTSTGAYGDYSVRALPPGRYLLRLELPGFQAAEFPDILILAGETARLDATIRIGDVATEIEVSAAAPVAGTWAATVSRNIGRDEFDRLPKTRSFQQLATLAPGVNLDPFGGGLGVNGASAAENLFVVDGSVTNSPIHGGSRQDAVFEHLEQVQVVRGAAPPAYAGALGGVVTAISRSGGNELHGDIHVYYSGAGLAAGPARRLVLDPADDQGVGFVQDAEDARRTFEGGFSLGGPILADRLFFFTSWSPRWSNRERIYRLNSGQAEERFDQDETLMSGFTKISFESGSRARGNLAMLWTPTDSRGVLAALNGFGPNWDSRSPEAMAPNRARGFFQPQSSYSANLDISLSRDVFLGLQGGYFWDDYKDTGVPPVSSVEYMTSAVGLAGVPLHLQQGVGFTNTPRIRFTRHDRTTRASGAVEVAVSGSQGGFHDFKAGYGIQKAINDVESSFPGGGYVLVFWDSTFTASPTGAPDRGPLGYYEVHEAGTIGSTGARIQSVFAQDQWTVHPTLTLNLGIRLEQEVIPAFRPDASGAPFRVTFDWGQKISPRLGASWDPRGDGRVRVYGSYGRFVDWNKFEWVRGALGAEVWRVRYRSLDTPEVFSLSPANMPGRDLWLPSTPDSFRDLRASDYDLAVDPALKPMAQEQYILGVDYEWSPARSLGVRYLHNNLIRAVEDFARIVGGNAVFTYGNPGEGIARTNQSPSTATPPFELPRPRRTYDAVELTATRRFTEAWFGEINYTWSRLRGNYPGLANADDVRTPTLGFGFAAAQQQAASIGRPGGNTSFAWDLDEVLFDSHGNLDVTGPLPGDRPHVFKLAGGYERSWEALGATDIGVFFYAGSGTPLSTRVNTAQRLPVFVNGRGDMGRTPMLSYTDLAVGHTVPTGERQELRFEITLLNLFNQKTAVHRFEHLNRGAGGSRDASAIDLQSVNLFDGYDYTAMIEATPDGAGAFDPRYGMDDLFLGGFQARLGARWTF